MKLRGMTENEKDAEIERLRSLLRHAALRNHPHSPESCSMCEMIEAELGRDR